MGYDILKATRESGDWVNGECPYRAKPCGNPTCVDEAMRAGMIYQNNDIARASSTHTLIKAQKKVRSCAEEGHRCPLGGLDDRLNVIDTLYSTFKSPFSK